MRKSSKGLIILEAFKLFSCNTYEQVTYNELEKSTNLSRGALLYHFKTKEDIFKAVCDKYLIQESSIQKKIDERISPEMTLKQFIDLYIEIVREIKYSMKELGIKNINKALINITNQATYYYPNFEIDAMKWQARQIQLWNDVLKKAKKQGEIRKDLDIDTLSDLFEDIYCGISYSGIVYPEGIEIERLEKAFHFIYKAIV